MNKPKWSRQQQAQTIRIKTKQHLREQFAEGVKEQRSDEESGRKERWVLAHPMSRADHDKARGCEIRQRVASQNRPEKFLRCFEIAVQAPSVGIARANEPPD